MKKLVALLALSLVTFASAGGNGPRPNAPLAVGQVWELNAQDKSGATITTQIQIKQLLSQDPSGQILVGNTLLISNEAGFQWFPDGQLLQVSVNSPEHSILICWAELKGNTSKGYILNGIGSAVQKTLEAIYAGKAIDMPTLFQGVKNAGNGTCTLKHLC